MMRLNSVARPAKLSALMTIGSGLLSGFLLGCPGNLDPALAGGGGAGGSGSPGCQDAIFTSICATAVCHSVGVHPAGLILTPPVSASQLVGVAPDGTSLCNGMGKVFLQAGVSPATGIFLDNLVQATPACGFQMPYNQAPLSPAQVTCLQNWANGLTGGGGASGQ